MPIRHPRPILRHMIQWRQLLPPTQPPRRHRRIRNNPPGQPSKQARHHAQHHKHRPPPTERRSGTNILKPKTHQPADDLRHAEPAVPEAEARRLLRPRVPLRPHEHEARRDGGLEDAEEDARYDERGVVVGGGGAGGGVAPEGDVEAEPFAGGGPLEDVA
jgi:hypothetical protein